MYIGKRNHQIIIKRAAVITTLGVPVESLSTVATVWASKKNVSQVRLLENGVESLDGTVLFNIIYYDYPTLDKTCFFFEGSTRYVIDSIVINEKVDIDIVCKIKT